MTCGSIRGVKRFVWTVLFLSIVLGLVVPTVFFLTAAKLPQLDSEFDLERELRLLIEGERIAFKSGRIDADTIDHRFARPDFPTLPKDVVAFYITHLGCPTFFQTPREEGLAWSSRVVVGALFSRNLEGDGKCELLLARRLAERIGAKTALQRHVAAHKLHGFLQKDQLVAYDLEAQTFDRGVIGIRAAALALFEAPIDRLSLGEMAELTLALPTNGVYGELQRCQNPSRLREWRNALLTQLEHTGLIAPERAADARDEPISCLRGAAKR